MDDNISDRARGVSAAFDEAYNSRVGTGDDGLLQASEELEDAHTRFRLWAGNLGAFHPRRDTRSLDYRLRQERAVTQRILDILAELADLIKRFAAWDSDRDSAHMSKVENHGDGMDDFLEDFLDLKTSAACEISWLTAAISDSVGRLLKISRLVEKSTTRDRYARAEASADTQFDHRYDLDYVRTKYASQRAEPWLIDRLAKAITKRRMFLRYARQHRDKLWSTPELQTSNPVLGDDVIDQPRTAQSTRPTEVSKPSLQQTTASTLVGINLDAVDDGFDEERTCYTKATSISDGRSPDRLRVPKLEEFAARGEPFECPYCCTMQKFNGQITWEKHVFSDLRAYLCTSKACGMTIFARKEEWIAHELEEHRRRWQCQLCGHASSRTEDALLCHIRSAHGSTLSPAILKALVKTSSRPIDTISVGSCLFCDWTSIMRNINKSIGEGQDLVVSSHRFMRHLAGHLEELALFAIPRGGPGDSDDGESCNVGFRGLESISFGIREYMNAMDNHSQEYDASSAGGKADGVDIGYALQTTKDASPTAFGQGKYPPALTSTPAQPATLKYDQRLQLQINGDLRTMTEGWNAEEASNRRRFVQFWRTRSGSLINITFAAASSVSESKGFYVSCIRSQDKQECYITDTDLTALLEYLAGSKLTDDARKRTGEALDDLRPVAHSSTEPEDHGVIPWRMLSTALEDPIIPFVDSRHSHGSLASEDSNRGLCPIPTCGRDVEDLRTHMLTHQNERREKCLIPTCEYYTRGFARNVDRNRHVLTHYNGTIECDFCPPGKIFNRVDVFKRHLTSVHSVERTPPNAQRRSLPSSKQQPSTPCEGSGVCSACKNTFANAQDLSEHLDDCILRILQQENLSEAIVEKLLTSTFDRKALEELEPLPVTIDAGSRAMGEMVNDGFSLYVWMCCNCGNKQYPATQGPKCFLCSHWECSQCQRHEDDGSQPGALQTHWDQQKLGASPPTATNPNLTDADEEFPLKNTSAIPWLVEDLEQASVLPQHSPSSLQNLNSELHPSPAWSTSSMLQRQQTQENSMQNRKHALDHVKPYACAISGCSRKEGFATANDLRRHQKVVHRYISTGPAYVCAVCPEGSRADPKIWPRLDRLKAHVRRKHPSYRVEDVIEVSTSLPSDVDSASSVVQPGSSGSRSFLSPKQREYLGLPQHKVSSGFSPRPDDHVDTPYPNT